VDSALELTARVGEAPAKISPSSALLSRFVALTQIQITEQKPVE